MHYNGCKKKSKKRSGFAGFIHILKTAHLKQLNEMQSCQLGKRKGYHFSIEGYMKEVPFLLKIAYKRVRGWTSGHSLPV